MAQKEKLEKFLPLFKIVVSAGLIAIVLKKVGLKNFATTLMGINSLSLASAIGITLFILILAAHRWRLCMLAQDIDIGLGDALNYTLIGFFFNNFFPSTVGGDVIKGVIAGRSSKKGIGTAVSIVIDRLTGLIAMGMMAVIALFISFNLALDRRIKFLVILFVSIVIAAQILIFNRGIAHKSAAILKRCRIKAAKIISDKIASISDSFYIYRTQSSVIKRAITVSFVMWIGNILVSFVLALGLGVELPFKYFVIIVPLILAIMSIPISFGGLGLREWAYITLFGMAGVQEEKALAISISYYMVTLLLSLVGGVLLLKSKI